MAYNTTAHKALAMRTAHHSGDKIIVGTWDDASGTFIQPTESRALEPYFTTYELLSSTRLRTRSTASWDVIGLTALCYAIGMSICTVGDGMSKHEREAFKQRIEQRSTNTAR